MVINTVRETVKVNGQWVKSVRWHDTRMTPKSVVLTHVESEAARFLPAHAAEIRRVYSPARQAAIADSRRQVEAAAAAIFAEAITKVSADMGRDVRSILKGIL